MKGNFQGVAGDSRYFENKEESNLIRWQLTGLGLLGDLVKVSFTTGATTGALVLGAYRYSWDQDLGDGSYSAPAQPVLARTAVGTYTIVVPAFGTDENGVSVPIVLTDARADAQGSARRASAESNGTTTLTVYVRDAVTGALSDTATVVVVRGSN